jgi:uncharacterized membrane protein
MLRNDTRSIQLSTGLGEVYAAYSSIRNSPLTGPAAAVNQLYTSLLTLIDKLNNLFSLTSASSIKSMSLGDSFKQVISTESSVESNFLKSNNDV